MRGAYSIYAGSRGEREKKIYLVCKDPNHAAQGPEKEGFASWEKTWLDARERVQTVNEVKNGLGS